MYEMMPWRPSGVIEPAVTTLSPDSALHIVGVPEGSRVTGSVSGVLSGVAGASIPASYAPPMGGAPGYYAIALGGTPLVAGQTRALVDVSIILPSGETRSASIGAGNGITASSFDLFRAASSFTGGEKVALGVAAASAVALAAWALWPSGKQQNPRRKHRR